MNTYHRIKFGGTIQSERRRPGLLTWLVLATILVVAVFVPVVGLPALVLFVAFYLPAALGSSLGCLVGGARDEVRAAWRMFRRRV
jgi:hypothetical protein